MHRMPPRVKELASAIVSKRECPRHPGGRCACGMGNLYRFVEPLLLLELARTPGASGYDLLERLKGHTLTGTTIDKAAVYRTLCLLESEGMASVEHQESARGGGKKAYSLTQKGKDHLREWGLLLGNLAEGLSQFSQQVGEIRH